MEVLTIQREETDCYCINLRRANCALTKKYDEMFKGIGITVNQFSILNNIEKLVDCNIKELASVMGLERTSLLRNIKPLVEQGYVLIKKEQKLNIYYLSEKGNTIRMEGKTIWDDVQIMVEKTLGNEHDKLIELLSKIERI